MSFMIIYPRDIFIRFGRFNIASFLANHYQQLPSSKSSFSK